MRCIKRTLLCAAVMICTGCTHMELFIKDSISSNPSRILIGGFDARDMAYDPFIAEEFRESLRFSLFRRGCDVTLWQRGEQDKKNYDTQADAAALCSAANSDILITGVVSRKECGSFADRKVYYSVSFVIRDKSGTVSGEGNYSDSNVDAPVFIREAAESFACEFLGRVNRK